MKNTRNLQLKYFQFNILAGTLVAEMTLYPAAGNAQDEASADDYDVVIEEIVVTGIRGS